MTRPIAFHIRRPPGVGALRRAWRPASAALALLAIVLFPLMARAQAASSADVDASLRLSLEETCGTGDAGRFEALSRQVDPDRARTLLLQILTDGASAASRDEARRAARRRHAQQRAVLARPTAHLFDAETAQRLRGLEADRVAEESVRRLDRTVRGNAIRWLGLLGQGGQIDAIRAAAVRDPALARLAEAAIAAIRKR